MEGPRRYTRPHRKESRSLSGNISVPTRPMETRPNNSFSPHKYHSEISASKTRKTNERSIFHATQEHSRHVGGGTAGLKAGLGAARLHHSRRREFCCLEPGAGGGTRTPRGGRKPPPGAAAGLRYFSGALRGEDSGGAGYPELRRDKRGEISALALFLEGIFDVM